MEFPISPSEERAAESCAPRSGCHASLSRLLVDIATACIHLDKAVRYGEVGDPGMHIEIAAARALLHGVLA